MPRRKKVSAKNTSVSNNISSYVSKIENEFQTNQSKVSMVLGALIVLVIGVLVFNYFNKSKPSLGPAQQTQNEISQQDVAKDQLPGKYTVKEGDTLFLIAQSYYDDGSRFEGIVKTNKLASADVIETGQVLEIPKLETQIAQATPQPTTQPTVAPSAQPTEQEALGTGGGNSTIWGDRIEGNSYTVIEGDWLSTVAGRAYGDIMAFEKIAKANNIVNPDHIEPGQVLVIPR